MKCRTIGEKDTDDFPQSRSESNTWKLSRSQTHKSNARDWQFKELRYDRLQVRCYCCRWRSGRTCRCRLYGSERIEGEGLREEECPWETGQMRGILPLQR